MIVLDASIVGPWTAQRAGCIFHGDSDVAIGWERDGEIVGGLIFTNYMPAKSIWLHVALEGGANRQLAAIAVDYPFMQLGVQQLITCADSGNANAMRLNRRFGFSEFGRVNNAAPDGDLVFFSMNREGYQAVVKKYGYPDGRR